MLIQECSISEKERVRHNGAQNYLLVRNRFSQRNNPITTSSGTITRIVFGRTIMTARAISESPTQNGETRANNASTCGKASHNALQVAASLTEALKMMLR